MEDGGGEAGAGVVNQAEGPADQGEECGGVGADFSKEQAVDDDPACDAGGADGVGPQDVAAVALQRLLFRLCGGGGVGVCGGGLGALDHPDDADDEQGDAEPLPEVEFHVRASSAGGGENADGVDGETLSQTQA